MATIPEIKIHLSPWALIQLFSTPAKVQAIRCGDTTILVDLILPGRRYAHITVCIPPERFAALDIKPGQEWTLQAVRPETEQTIVTPPAPEATPPMAAKLPYYEGALTNLDPTDTVQPGDLMAEPGWTYWKPIQADDRFQGRIVGDIHDSSGGRYANLVFARPGTPSDPDHVWPCTFNYLDDKDVIQATDRFTFKTLKTWALPAKNWVGKTVSEVNLVQVQRCIFMRPDPEQLFQKP